MDIMLTLSSNEHENVQFECGCGSQAKKKRPDKGESVDRYVSDYCVFDLETTSAYVNMADIIEISAVRVRDNRVVAEFSTLVNPRCAIPSEASGINNITDDMVKDAPKLKDVIDEFLSFVQEDVLVGYNCAAYDMNLMYDCVQRLKGIPFRNNYIDIYHAAKRSVDGIQKYNLETISRHFGISTEGAHRALKDCYLTKECYDKIYEEYGDVAFQRRSSRSGGKRVKYSSETVALKELQSILEDILDDGIISLDELNLLSYWLEEHIELAENYPFDRVFDAFDDALDDGCVCAEDLETLKSIFEEILDPVKCQSCQMDTCVLTGKHICMTGEFSYGSKNAVADLIEQAGGIIDKSVKKATNYVVVGAQGSENWKTGNYGSKILKAMEYNKKGMDIKIIEEQDFIPMAMQCIEIENANADNDKCDCIFDWKIPVQSMLDELALERGLPEGSLHIVTNVGNDGKKVTSYSVCINEPNYPMPSNAKRDPARNSIVLNVKEDGSSLELLVRVVRFDAVGVPVGAEIRELKSDKANVHVVLQANSDSLIGYIKKCTEHAIENYESKAASFGCCSLFNECSDAKRCVHENLLYSKACVYRSNLEAGRIFYGKNRNID